MLHWCKADSAFDAHRYDEMLQIVQSIYDMTGRPPSTRGLSAEAHAYPHKGEMVKLPPDEDTAQKVRQLAAFLKAELNLVTKACRQDLRAHGPQPRPPACVATHSRVNPRSAALTPSSSSVTFEEFKEGSKKDPTIVQVCHVHNGAHASR